MSKGACKRVTCQMKCMPWRRIKPGKKLENAKVRGGGEFRRLLLCRMVGGVIR